MQARLTLSYASRFLVPLVLLGSVAFSISLGQEVVRPIGVPGRAVDDAAVPEKDGDDQEKSEEPELSDDALAASATLETDPEVETLFARATDFIDAKQYSMAVRLLQKVIDDSGSNLTHIEDGLHIPSRRHAERLLAALPEEGLALYKIAADAEVSAIRTMATDHLSTAALETVRKRYFLSTDGDELAFLLACRYIDESQPSKALTLLDDLLTHYPNTTVPRDAILLRKAYVHACMGEADLAESSFKQVQKTVATSASSLKAVEAHVTIARSGADQVDKVREVEKPDIILNAEGFARIWQVDIEPVAKKDKTSESATFRHLVSHWQSGASFPTDTAAIADGKVYVNGQKQLRCFDATTGQLVWESTPVQQKGPSVRHYSSNSSQYKLSQEIGWAFGNSLGKAVGVHAGIVYHLQPPITSRYYYSNTSQSCILLAHSATSGKLLWRSEGRHVGIPVAIGKHVLVPVETNEGLSLYAMNPKSGKVLWKRFLCAYLAGRANPYNTVAMEVYGDAVYVGTGQGVVVAVNGHTGDIRWATRYQREKVDRNSVRHWSPYRPSLFSNWVDNSIHCLGRSVVVTPVDANMLLGFDRATGKPLYRVERDDAKYAIGSYDDTIVVAGKEGVHCVDGITGKTVWKTAIEESHGKGVICGDYLTVPTKGGIDVLDIRNGKRIRSLACKLPGGVPLGNLHVTPNSVLAVALGRLYATADHKEHLESLNKLVEGKKTMEAYEQRAYFLATIGRHELAANDFIESLSKRKDQAKNIATSEMRIKDLRTQLVAAEESFLNHSLKTKSSWSDDFSRESLGDGWISKNATVGIESGALVFNSSKQYRSTLILDKEFSGDVCIQFDAKRTGKYAYGFGLSLQFQDDGKQPVDLTVFIGMGRRNKYNQVQIGRRMLSRNSEKVLKLNETHHVQVCRVGSQIWVRVDGKLLHNVRHESIPESSSLPFKLALSAERPDKQFFDTIKLAELDPKAATAITDMKDGILREINSEESNVKTFKMKQTLYAATQSALVRSLLSAAKQRPERADEFLAKAMPQTRTKRERVEVSIATAQAHESVGQLVKAVTRYLSLLDGFQSEYVHTDSDRMDHGIFVPELVARRLSRSTFRNDTATSGAINAYADKRFAELNAAKDATGLWNLYSALPWIEQAGKIGFAAMAHTDGGAAQVEAGLSVMTYNENHAIAAEATKRLAEHYERHTETAMAQAVWRELAATHGDVMLETAVGPQTGRAIAQKALSKLTVTSKPMPSPSYKRVWTRNNSLASFSGSLTKTYAANGTKAIAWYDYRKRQVIGLDSKTGKTLWATKTNNTSGRPISSLQGSGRFDGHHMQIIGNGSKLIALDLATGKAVWSIDVDKVLGSGSTSLSGWTVTKGDGTVVLINQQLAKVCALDAFTGRPMWFRTRRGVFSAKAKGGQVFLSWRDGITTHSGVIRVHPHNSTSGNRWLAAYDRETGLPMDAFKPLKGYKEIAAGGILHPEDGKLHYRSLKTGESLWSVPRDKEKTVFHYYRDGHAIFVVSDGTITRYDEKTGKKTWSVKPKAPLSLARPLFFPESNEFAFHHRGGNDDRLAFMELSTGKLKGNLRIQRRIKVDGGQVYIAWIPSAGIGERFIAVSYMLTTRQNKRTKQVRTIRFIDKETGKLVANCSIPEENELGSGSAYYRAISIDGILIVSSSNKMIAYEHDPKGPELILEKTADKTNSNKTDDQTQKGDPSEARPEPAPLPRPLPMPLIRR